jgi:hypothetical protein
MTSSAEMISLVEASVEVLDLALEACKVASLVEVALETSVILEEAASLNNSLAFHRWVVQDLPLPRLKHI